MLALPTRGLYSTSAEHRIDITAICDWIEGNILFQVDQTLSRPQIVDALIENELVNNQETAWTVVEDAVAELQRRGEWLGNGRAIDIQANRFRCLLTWRQSVAHAFCLMLSFAQWYPGWARQFGKNYSQQGELFECFTREAIKRLLPGWEAQITGWSRAHTKYLDEVVSQVAEWLVVQPLELRPWTKKTAKEEGLDIVCYFSFLDGRSNFPAYFLQCASGGDWEAKRHTPSLDTWKKIIDFTVAPQKAFSIPHALRDDDFRRHGNFVQGVIFDRHRLLLPNRQSPNWLSGQLQKGLLAWLRPRIKALSSIND